MEKVECDCHKQRTGKIASIFLKQSKASFWMSNLQLKHHEKVFPFLKKHNNIVLSSVFSKGTISYFKNISETNKKSDKWGILESGSWVKGTGKCVSEIKHEKISGLSHRDFLKKLSSIKGLIFHPSGGDTCPRMIIEAKLLGCELDLNENVQHKDEDWFSTKEKILKHLETRANVFWKEISKYVNEIPRAKTSEKTHFKIIVPFYNAEKWIDKCINSIKIQNYDNFECYLIDDISTDNSLEIVQECVKEDDRFIITSNDEKKYALHNIHDAIEESNIEDDDVIVLLDGDDWLSSPSVLSKLDEVYEDPDCWLTYGSYIMHPFGTRGVEPSEYPKNII